MVSLDSGSSGVKVTDLDKSDVVRLRKYVCWMCNNLRYCSHCKKFECILGRPLTKVACGFRKDAEVLWA